MSRGRLFNLRMNDAESARLKLVAEHYGLSLADTIRMLLKVKFEEIQKR